MREHMSASAACLLVACALADALSACTVRTVLNEAHMRPQQSLGDL